MPQQSPLPVQQLPWYDYQTRECPSTQYLKLLSLNLLYHPVQPFGFRAVRVGHIPAAGYHTVHTTVRNLDFADCTDRIGFADSDMESFAAAVVDAVADFAVAAMEASVAEVDLAAMVVAVAVVETVVQAEADPLAAKAFLSAVQVESAVGKEASVAFAGSAEGDAALVLAQRPTVHLMRSETTFAQEFLQMLDQFLHPVSVLLVASLVAVADCTENDDPALFAALVLAPAALEQVLPVSAGLVDDIVDPDTLTVSETHHFDPPVQASSHPQDWRPK